MNNASLYKRFEETDGYWHITTDYSYHVKEILNSNTVTIEIKKNNIFEKDINNLVVYAENEAFRYAEERFTRYDIDDFGFDYVYNIIIQHIEDYLDTIIIEQYDFNNGVDEWEDIMINGIIDTVIRKMDVDKIYNFLEELYQQPITISEKLRDIGMSEKSFL